MTRIARGTRIRALASAALASLFGLAVVAAGGVAAHAATGAPTAGSGCPSHVNGGPRVNHFGGLVHPQAHNPACRVRTAGDAGVGTPPLLFHGGAVMGTASTGPVVVTPIYWTPSGHPIDATYRHVIDSYLADVAGASGQRTNVYSTLAEYYGNNGSIRYRLRLGTPISDTHPLPTDGCKVNGRDQKNIYSDRTGYDSCLSDSQVIAETDQVRAAHGLPRDNGHLYVMFLPKHVESCFYGGSTTTSNNYCTINHQPSAAYCAYHAQAPSSTIYANMAYPIYNSPVGYTCGSDATFATVQSPNGDPDADVEISPTSHEIMEAITDPDTVTGWYDSSDYENGDECAYIYGATQGAAGQLYNQVIRSGHYLTQEEFSNRDFFATGGGCLQSE